MNILSVLCLASIIYTTVHLFEKMRLASFSLLFCSFPLLLLLLLKAEPLALQHQLDQVQEQHVWLLAAAEGQTGLLQEQYPV